MAIEPFQVYPPTPGYKVSGLMRNERFRQELHDRMLFVHRTHTTNEEAKNPKSPVFLATACLILSSPKSEQEVIWYFVFTEVRSRFRDPHEILEVMKEQIFSDEFKSIPLVGDMPVEVRDIRINPKDFQGVDQYLKGYFGEEVISPCDYLKTELSEFL